ncbi:MAG TPA: DoxX family protein [Brumimicrobium sp.]|nr:DoxX family protein [Brumimicrobium sp.]
MFHKIINSNSSNSTLLIRLMVGVVFVSEGIQKFLIPSVRGAGRFENIGLPYSEHLASFVASFEIICGALILIGLLTRLASIPIIIIMIVALITTKSKIFIDLGFWEMMHASRTDWAMLIGSLFLLIKGSGNYSIDALITRIKKRTESKGTH